MNDLQMLKGEYRRAKTRAWGFIGLRHVTAPLSVATDAYVKALEQRIWSLENGGVVYKSPFAVMRAEFAEDNHALECLVSFWQAYTSAGNPVKWGDIRYHDSIPLLRKWRLIQMIDIGKSYELTERGIAYVKAEHDKLKKEMGWDNAYAAGYTE